MTSRVTTGRAILRFAGELLITAGIVLLLFVGYELYGTGLTTAREQARLERELAHAWETPPPAVDRPAQAVRPVQAPGLGEPVAVLTVPRLGEDYRHVVVEGVGREELKMGPGHQPGRPRQASWATWSLPDTGRPTAPPSGASTRSPPVTRSS